MAERTSWWRRPDWRFTLPLLPLGGIAVALVAGFAAMAAVVTITAPGWETRLVALIATLGGVFVVAAFYDLLLPEVASWRRGAPHRPGVLALAEHVVVLHATPALFSFAERWAAQARHADDTLVVLTPDDAAMLESALLARVPALANVKLICRNGMPDELTALAALAPDTARAVVLVSAGGSDGDGRVVRSALALTHALQPSVAPGHLVAAVQDDSTAGVLHSVGSSELATLATDRLLGALLAGACTSPGLLRTVEALLGSREVALSVVEQSELTRNTFGDALMAYETSMLVGLRDPAGKHLLAPTAETLFSDNAAAIMLARDGVAPRVATEHIALDVAAISIARPDPPAPRRTLLLGWNRRGPHFAYALSRHATPGSVLTIAADTPTLTAEVEALRLAGGALAVELGVADISALAILEALELPSYDTVVVLGYDEGLTPDLADTRTLVTVLAARQIAAAHGARLQIIAELHDEQDRALALATGADDAVAIDSMVGQLLAQAVHDRTAATLLRQLIAGDGARLRTRPAATLVTLEREVNFYTVVEAARERDEVAIGFIELAGTAQVPKGGQVVLNPPKTLSRRYTPDERIIVLSRS